jgi:hypothetical protein
VKDAIVKQRGYKAVRTVGEDVTEFGYQPGNCNKPYRVVALRKDLSAEGVSSSSSTTTGGSST